jgi:hypothetical protein
VLRIPGLRVEYSDESGEMVGALRLNTVVEPGVERVEVELVGGEAVSQPW